MSEMLGNQYFLARRYCEACLELEAEIRVNSENHRARKKLIICYIKTGQLAKALDNFYELVFSNYNSITATDLKKDDCPCLEIISEVSENSAAENSSEYYLKLGILWLYCDESESLRYLDKIPNDDLLYNKIKEIKDQIKSHIYKIN